MVVDSGVVVVVRANMGRQWGAGAGRRWRCAGAGRQYQGTPGTATGQGDDGGNSQQGEQTAHGGFAEAIHGCKTRMVAQGFQHE